MFNNDALLWFVTARRQQGKETGISEISFRCHVDTIHCRLCNLAFFPSLQLTFKFPAATTNDC